jgi:hypothetical protein
MWLGKKIDSVRKNYEDFCLILNESLPIAMAGRDHGI